MSIKTFFASLLGSPVTKTDIPPASPWADNSHLQQLLMNSLFGTDDIVVSRSSAMGLSVIAKARNMIAPQIGRFPIIAMRGISQLDPQPTWLNAPDPAYPRSTLITWTVDDMFFHGRAYWLIIRRDAAGKPLVFRRLTPDNWGENSDGILVSAAGQPVTPSDWIRFDAPSEGLLIKSAEDIRTGIDARLSLAKGARSQTPEIELHQTGGADLDEDDIDNLLQSWAAARNKRAGGVAFTPPSIQAVDHGKLEADGPKNSKSANDIDLARDCGIPGWAVDAAVTGSGITYQNVPSRSRELLDYTLQPYMDALTDRLSLDDILPHGQWAKMDTSAFLRGDFTSRMQGYKAAIDAGVYTADECRALEAGIPLEQATNQQQDGDTQ